MSQKLLIFSPIRTIVLHLGGSTMKMVILNMKEQYEFEIIKKVKYGKLSNNSAQIKLGVSRRTDVLSYI
jgi:predicted DNA-binding protein (UPF0251 family)